MMVNIMKPGFSVSKCAILADYKDPEREAVIEAALKELLPELSRVGISTELFLNPNVETLCPKKDTDVFLVLGGDGSMIQFAGNLAHYNVPFYGMNYGNVGFMMNTLRHGLRYHAEKLKAGEFSTWSFPFLEVEATDQDGNKHHGHGLNDIYLQRMTPQSCKARVSIDTVPLRINPILCDGLIVATPLGSTAYSYNITGSLVGIDTPVLTLTPIAAHRSCQVSCMVLPQDTHIEFEILEPRKRRVQVVCDGTSHGDIIQAVVSLSSKRVSLCFDYKNSKHLTMRFLNKAFRRNR